MLAYIVLQLREADENSVLERLKSFKEVKNAHVIFGEWDIIAKVEVQDAENLASFMIDKVRPMKEVKLSSTMIVAK